MFRPPSPDALAYLDFSVSTTGILAGVKVGDPWDPRQEGGEMLRVGHAGRPQSRTAVLPLQFGLTPANLEFRSPESNVSLEVSG